MHTHWRLALMLDDPRHDLAALKAALGRSGDAIADAATGHHLRLGIADRHPDLGQHAARYESTGVAGVDGAIEVTFANDRRDAIPDVCAKLRSITDTFCDAASVHVMTGPVHYMVPVRTGDTFLSLAFRRDAATTSAQFQDWWFNQHAPLAISVLGEGLLAYDQVHVDDASSQVAAAAFGVPHVEYDAYDNLTWADRYAFLHSISDEQAMVPVYADELGRIAPAGKRSAIMKTIR